MNAPLPRPANHDGSFWIDEQIWGHRLYDEQTPWLTFLEFLNIFAFDKTLNSAPDMEYQPQRQLRLRNVIFNNPHFPEVMRDPPLPDQAAWTRWIELMSNSALQMDGGDVATLRDQIPQFADFERLVRYLRRTAIEGSSNKRWSSKFVFPFGSNALYEDLRVNTDKSPSNDRRFFARSGELLYMMLARSKRAASLEQALKERFFDSPDPTNAVIGLLQGETTRAPEARALGYLPMPTLPEYDALAEDWCFLLDQPLPKFDALPHLVTITGLHLLIYFLRRASATVPDTPRPTFVCEIMAPRRTAVRDVALRSFETNQALPRMAVERLIRSTVDLDGWVRALADPEPLQAAARVLAGRFDWPEDDDLEKTPAKNPTELLEQLVTNALTRHKQHVAKIHGTWARNIGLSSRRGSLRVRYAPTDALLKSLVFANVGSRMEFKEFLARLHERYGLIIGEHQGTEYIESGVADLEDFAENAVRLEERLTSLGLMNRLSDGCAYVQLPFAGRKRHG